jgi:hypothetical protein
MLSSDIVKLRNALALTRIFEFGRALAFQERSMTVKIGGDRAAMPITVPRGERYVGDECTRMSLFPSCAPKHN